MSFISKVRKATLAAGAVTLATGAAVAGTAAAASAATPHKLKICAYGNYAAYAEIPQQGGAASFLAFPGHCESIGLVNGTSSAKIYGLYNSGNYAKFYVGTAHFSASKGWFGAAEGKTTSHYLRKF
jgi:hypothetical protein